MAEADFVVVSAHGVLVLEVKGGRVARRGGIWEYTDRYGEVHANREGPFAQANGAMFGLRTRLKERLPQLDAPFGFAVITPDTDLPTDVEWVPEIAIGASRCTASGLRRALSGAMKYWKGKHSRALTPTDWQNRVASSLRPDFDRAVSLSAILQQAEREFLRLTDSQYAAIEAQEFEPRILCSGGAGSGKTILAAEIARREAEAGGKVLLTCRSQILARQLSSDPARNNLQVVPFECLRAAQPADVLVVDEGQDLLNADDLLVLDHAVTGGLDGGRWRIFLDENSQAAVGGRFESSALAELRRYSTGRLRLKRNCRNTAPIVTQTQMVTGADVGVAMAGAGPHVTYVPIENDEDTARVLDTELHRLVVDEDLPPADIAVVSCRSDLTLSAAQRSSHFRRRRLLPFSGADSRWPAGTALVTSSDIKGLERPYICVIDVDSLDTDESIAHLYVAMTRARAGLWLALAAPAWRTVAKRGRESISRSQLS